MTGAVRAAKALQDDIRGCHGVHDGYVLTDGECMTAHIVSAFASAREDAIRECAAVVRNLAGRDSDATHGILISKGEALRVLGALIEPTKGRAE